MVGLGVSSGGASFKEKISILLGNYFAGAAGRNSLIYRKTKFLQNRQSYILGYRKNRVTWLAKAHLGFSC